MTDDFERRLRERLHLVGLPPAPTRLRVRLAANVESPAPGVANLFSRLRIVALLATVIVVPLVATAVLVGSDQSESPSPSVPAIAGPTDPSAPTDPPPPTDPALPADSEAPRIVCADEIDVPGVRLTCQQAVEAALAHLVAIGEDPPPSSRLEFTYGCRDVSGVAVDCAAQLSGFVNVYSVSPDRLEPHSEGYGSTSVLFVQGNGASATGELIYVQSFQISCEEEEPPALVCAEIVDAALRYGDFGRKPGPVANVEVYRFCDTTCDPAFKSVLVDLHLSSEIGTVELTVYLTPEGPGVQQLGSFLPRFRPPYGDEPPRELATPIEAVALRHERTDALQDLYLLTVEFYGNGCLERYQPWVDVTADRVRLAIVALPDVRPRPSGVLCTMAAYVYTYQLELPKPFEGTIVEDLSNGRTFEVETYVTQPAPT